MPNSEADERFEKKAEETREGGVKLDRVGDVKSTDNILAHLKSGDKVSPTDAGTPEESKAADSLSKKFADRALSQAGKSAMPTDQLSAGAVSETPPQGGIGGVMGMVEHTMARITNDVLKDVVDLPGLDKLSQAIADEGANAAGQPSKLDTAQVNKAMDDMKQMMSEMSEADKDAGALKDIIK